MTEPARLPAIPDRLLDPRPAMAAGTLAWAIGLVACLVTGHGGAPLCGIGLGARVAGYAVFALQRRAVRRGSAGAQTGAGLGTGAPPAEPAAD